ncbi:hypothetical protein [Dubosiella newyorkensis]|jgi:hypothetical protein|uniref:hypothetical protein n=1 Tax=Dubosiella newyorkensis TaxID=1862672 RepID=UPI0023579CF6|nr:hypothetical protein [Dubosiella newyorkensis]MCI9041415.1 hypothetical protein [Dubosiella newyorkensis]
MLFSMIYFIFMLPLSIVGWFLYGNLLTKLLIGGGLALLSWVFQEKAKTFWKFFGGLLGIDLIISFMVTSSRFGVPSIISHVFDSIGSFFKSLLWIALFIVGIVVIVKVIFNSFGDRSIGQGGYTDRDMIEPLEPDPTSQKPFRPAPVSKIEKQTRSKNLETYKKEYNETQEKFTLNQLEDPNFIIENINTYSDVVSAHKTITYYKKQNISASMIQKNEYVLEKIYNHAKTLDSEILSLVVGFLKSRTHLENNYYKNNSGEKRAIAGVRHDFANTALEIIQS